MSTQQDYKTEGMEHADDVQMEAYAPLNIPPAEELLSSSVADHAHSVWPALYLGENSRKAYENISEKVNDLLALGLFLLIGVVIAFAGLQLFSSSGKGVERPLIYPFNDVVDLRRFYADLPEQYSNRSYKQDSLSNREFLSQVEDLPYGEDRDYMLAQARLIISDGASSGYSDETLIRWMAEREMPLQTTILFANQLKKNHPELASKVGNHPVVDDYLNAIIDRQQSDSLRMWFYFGAPLLVVGGIYAAIFSIGGRKEQLKDLMRGDGLLDDPSIKLKQIKAFEEH